MEATLKMGVTGLRDHRKATDILICSDLLE